MADSPAATYSETVLSKDPLANPEPLIRRVYAYAAYRLGDGADAEDATSEAFERALRYRDSYDSRRGDPGAWLVGIARRCVDRILAARVPLAEPREADAGIDLEDEALTRLELAAALAGLSEHDRELVALRYGADLSARQIAELLESRTNTVEVALHRALERLRRQLTRSQSPPFAEPAAEGVRV
jgi:RNA polymerase sigma-70 factor (ECF subfamily)